MASHVVRRGGFASISIQADGSWGPYETAKRFKTIDDAEQFYRRFFKSDNYGVFPCSCVQREAF
jgi:hypothetical protein